jgi:hypothetical protein
LGKWLTGIGERAKVSDGMRMGRREEESFDK